MFRPLDLLRRIQEHKARLAHKRLGGSMPENDNHPVSAIEVWPPPR
jgi:hypothetical protein